MENITIETLRVIDELLSGKSAYAIAAKELTTVSNITRRIRVMEKKLDCSLFRNVKGHGLQPTELALSLKQQIENILTNYDSMLLAISDRKDKSEVNMPRFPLSMYHTWSETIFKARKPLLMGSFKSVNIEPENLESALLDDTIQFAIISLPRKSDNLIAIPISQDQPAVIVENKHPLANHTGVTCDDLQNHDLLAGLDSVMYRRKMKMMKNNAFSKLTINDNAYDFVDLFQNDLMPREVVLFSFIDPAKHGRNDFKPIPITDLPANELCLCTTKKHENHPMFADLVKIIVR